MIIKDSMVVIHLAKITILEKSREYFGKVSIAEKVYREILAGKERGFSDVNIVEDLINKNKIKVQKVIKNNLLEKAKEYNLQGGEGESVALYWQEEADYLASDDDNVRKKNTILNLNIIGTPAILLYLYQNKLIEKEKFMTSVSELKKIGWFSNAVIDKLAMEIK